MNMGLEKIFFFFLKCIAQCSKKEKKVVTCWKKKILWANFLGKIPRFKFKNSFFSVYYDVK